MASSSGTKGDLGQVPQTRMTQARPMMVEMQNEDDATADSERVPSSLASIAPILRVANEIEKDNRRVAYLCRFHAFEKAHIMNPTSRGRGARQFKTYRVNRLEMEEEVTKHQLASNDAREIQMYYKQFYLEIIRKGQYTKKPEEMVKIYQIATVLYDVLGTVVPTDRILSETERYAEEVKRIREQCEHYNILPLFALGVKPAINYETSRGCVFTQIKAAVRAIRNVPTYAQNTYDSQC